MGGGFSCYSSSPCSGCTTTQTKVTVAATLGQKIPPATTCSQAVPSGRGKSVEECCLGQGNASDCPLFALSVTNVLIRYSYAKAKKPSGDWFSLPAADQCRRRVNVFTQRRSSCRYTAVILVKLGHGVCVEVAGASECVPHSFVYAERLSHFAHLMGSGPGPSVATHGLPHG